MKNFTKHNFLTKNILFSISNFRGYFTLLILIYFPVYYFTCYSINVEFIFCIFIHYSSFINHFSFFIIQLNICNINFFAPVIRATAISFAFSIPIYFGVFLISVSLPFVLMIYHYLLLLLKPIFGLFGCNSELFLYLHQCCIYIFSVLYKILFHI